MARPRKTETNQIEIDETLELSEVLEQVEETNQIEIDENLNYNIEVINPNQHLKVGQTFKVSGNVAKNLLSKNLIKIL